jgi:hypothetical protein
MVSLRALYGAIRDGEATWTSVMENKAEQANGSNDKKDAELPACSAAAFEKKKVGWMGIVQSGKKTANELIATIQTKELLSDDQKMEIASWSIGG